jgi:hypothetical protein
MIHFEMEQRGFEGDEKRESTLASLKIVSLSSPFSFLFFYTSRIKTEATGVMASVRQVVIVAMTDNFFGRAPLNS